MVSLASGIACNRASTSSCAGLFATICCVVSFDGDAAVDAAVTGLLFGDAALNRPKSSILVEDSGRTRSTVGDVVRIGRRSESLVVAESDDKLVCGYDGALARCEYDGRAAGRLRGK